MEITASRPLLSRRVTNPFTCKRSGLALWVIVPALAALFVCVLSGGLALGQGTGPAHLTAYRAPVPQSHLYWHFLMYQNHLDRVAVQREKQGKNGDWLRDLHQIGLGFTATQFAPIRAAGVRIETEIKEIDAQAKAIIDADHAAHPSMPGIPREWRTAPPELKALSQKREEVLTTEISNLQLTLGPELAARLDAYIQSHIAPKVTIRTLHSKSPIAKDRLMKSLQNKEVPK